MHELRDEFDTMYQRIPSLVHMFSYFIRCFIWMFETIMMTF